MLKGKLKGSRILVLGMAYKKILMIKESPSLKITQLLIEKGACGI